MPITSFDNIAEIYDAIRRIPKREMKSILRAMKSELKGCKTILDAGIGTGRFALPLSKLGFSVFGVDISRNMMKFAQDKDQRELAVTDIRKLCFRDYSFDASLVVHVLHLLKDWQPAVHEIARVSRHHVISVVTRTEANESPRTRYIELRGELGYPLDRFDEGEEGLRQYVNPWKVIKVWEKEDEIDAKDIITYLQKRRSSVTWGLLDEVHDRIIHGLLEQFDHTLIKRKFTTEVAIWEAKSLLKYFSFDSV